MSVQFYLLGCGMAHIGCGVAQIGRGVAQLGCGVAQIRGDPPPSGSNEDNKSGIVCICSINVKIIKKSGSVPPNP